MMNGVCVFRSCVFGIFVVNDDDDYFNIELINVNEYYHVFHILFFLCCFNNNNKITNDGLSFSSIYVIDVIDGRKLYMYVMFNKEKKR